MTRAGRSGAASVHRLPHCPRSTSREDGVGPVTKACALTGTHREQLKVGDPFDVDVGISLDALQEL